MNIWIINQYAVPPTEPGGTRHYSHARGLIRRGHRVEIVATNFHHLSRRETPINTGAAFERQVIAGVPFTWLPTPSYTTNSARRVWNMFTFAAKVWRGAWSRALDAPDVILGSSPHPFGALAAERLARRHRVPFVLEVRDLWPQALVDVAGVSKHHPFVQLIGIVEKYLYRAADKIIMFSPLGTERVAATGNDPGKVVLIPNGVDLELSTAPERPIERDEFTVTYVGTHGAANYLDPMLDAAGLMQTSDSGIPVRFRFVGEGPEKPRLLERARREGLKNVSFEAPVRKDQIPGILGEADVLVLTTPPNQLYCRWMGFNKLYDYLASARPVIFSCNAVSSPVHESGAGVCVKAGDAYGIADAIFKLHALSAAKRWEMGLNGRRFIEQHHDVKTLAANLESTLVRVISSRNKYDRPAWNRSADATKIQTKI